MEQPTPDNYRYTQPNTLERKPSNIVSWLGFSFSLFVLVLLWVTLIITAVVIRNDTDTYSGGASAILMLFLLIGTPLGLAGLVLSIIGLVKASNSGGKRWIGTCGLVFTGLSILSIFAPVFLSSFFVKESATVVTPTHLGNAKQQEKGIIFIVDGYRLKCYDNTKKEDVNPYETRLVYPTQIVKELDVWFKMHNLTKDEPIILRVSPDTDYTKVSDLLEALKILGVTKYKLTTDLKNTAH